MNGVGEECDMATGCVRAEGDVWVPFFVDTDTTTKYSNISCMGLMQSSIPTEFRVRLIAGYLSLPLSKA